MHQVHLELAEQAYNQARLRAADAGFKSVDQYIADVVSEELSEDRESFDHLFTPECLAKIDKAAAQVKAGQFLTAEQADAELSKHREDWFRRNQR